MEVSVNVPCFLSGHISAYLQDKEAYLIDGVSIHGVSGGPVFYRDDNGNVIIAGIVTNYYPNPVQDQSWPGLAMFRAVAPLLRLYEAQSRTSIQALPELSVGGVSVEDPSKASAVP